jgi:hypothetical protein
MTDAQQEAGEVCNQLIDTVYDTTRIIRTVGPDLAVKMVKINDPKDEKSVDLTLGKYDVTIATGPSFASRRQEAVAQLMELAQKAPQVAEIGADIIVGEMDLINGQQLQERLKRVMPPQVLGDDADDGKSPDELLQQKMQAQKAQQMQDMQTQMALEGAQAELSLKQAQAQEAAAKAELAQAQALKAKSEAMGVLTGQPNPAEDAEAQRTAIMGFDAVTRRIAALEKGAMPGTPPLLAQHLSPIIAAAVGQALAKHLGFAPVELGLPSAEPDLGQTAGEDMAA